MYNLAAQKVFDYDDDILGPDAARQRGTYVGFALV